MKIIVDENIPVTSVKALREQGHDVLDIRGTEDQGMIEKKLQQKAIQEKRLLITTDKGFAEHRNEQHFGLLIVRLKQPTRGKIHQRILKAVQRYPAKQWFGLMLVMRDTFQSAWKSRRK